MLFGDFAESQSKVFEEAIDEEESPEDYGYFSDSDLEDDEDEKIAQSAPRLMGPAVDATAECEIGPENCEERVEKGRVVKIPDIAFVT